MRNHEPFVSTTNIDYTIASLRLLVDDLRDLRLGRTPDLSGAPVLDSWAPATRKVIALTGIVEGHPVVEDGRSALTSELYAIDPNGRWARTASRLYVLRTPFDPRGGRT